MRLQSLWIKNFRQFYGEQEIVFAGDEVQRNVTVIHGFNGAGKTALLNAFVWCLYGETTPDLEEPERLHNERAVAECAPNGEVEVALRLTYKVRDTTYVLQRVRRGTKDADGSLRLRDPELRMWKRGSDGELREEGKNPDERQWRVNQLLPESLYPFFFFNGERVERLASPEAYDEVEKGVKTLLDVVLFERGVNHLRTMVLPELGRELAKISGDAELDKLVSQQEELEGQRQGLTERITGWHDEVKALDGEIELLERRQAGIASLVALTSKRATVREEIQRLDREDATLTGDLGRVLSNNGYLGFAEEVFAKAEGIVSAARQRGDIPAKIKPQFVSDLQAVLKCICGRALGPNSPEWQALEEWKAATGLAQLEEAISQTAAMLAPLRQRRSSYYEEIDRIQIRRNELRETLRDKRADLAIVDQQIGDREHGEDAEELAALIAKRRQESNKKGLDLLLAEKEMQQIDQKVAEVREAIRRLNARDERAAVIKRQRDSAERVGDALEEIFEIQKSDVRSYLTRQVEEIWHDAAIKDYRASIGADYRLGLTKRVGTIEQPVYGASTGERQVLALSFVASLVRLAAEHAEDKDRGKILGVALGGEYPLVMDSPFGSLEDDYRVKVAEWVPKLSGQVVLLVSKTQWRNEVETAVSGRIGKQYILELHTGKGAADRTISLRGREHAYVVSSRDVFEHTRIREVQ